MKKLMCVISGMAANGAERVMSLIVNQAAADGIQVKLVLLSSPQIDYTLNETIETDYVGDHLQKGRVHAAAGRFLYLRNIIRNFHPDVILSFLTTCNIYTSLAACGTQIPVIVSERNDPVKDCPSKIRRIVRNLSYRLAKGFIFQTEDAKKCFSSPIQKRSVIIPNPVKRDLPYADRKNAEKTVVAAGRLTAQKNYPMLLESFAQFQKKHTDYKLCIYGEGELKETMRDLADKLGIRENVEFRGLSLNLHEEIRKAGMFVLSSDYEGISNSLLEAMSMGLPCISTDCPAGGSRFLIENERNGILTPVGDSSHLSKAMERVADDPAFADRIGENAKKYRERCSEDRIIQTYFDYMRKVSSTSENG